MKLLFDEAAGESNNKFHKGLNITVRLGQKYTSLDIHTPMRFENLKGEHLGDGLVVGLLYCQMKEIPQGLLGLEHDVNCHNLEGLLQCMQTVYAKEVLTSSMVTVIILKV